eukprot:scaffold1900_cov123-Cylindrotheca_fusiformis.AAC.27
MNNFSLILCVLAMCLYFPKTVHSWGFEILKRGTEGATRLRLGGLEPSVETNSGVESYHFELESMFNPSFDLNEFAFLQERADELAWETFSEGLFAEDTPDKCSGPDCDECLIPEEWKAAYSSDPTDVLELLGVKRAKPILGTATSTK